MQTLQVVAGATQTGVGRARRILNRSVTRPGLHLYSSGFSGEVSLRQIQLRGYYSGLGKIGDALVIVAQDKFLWRYTETY